MDLPDLKAGSTDVERQGLIVSPDSWIDLVLKSNPGQCSYPTQYFINFCLRQILRTKGILTDISSKLMISIRNPVPKIKLLQVNYYSFSLKQG